MMMMMMMVMITIIRAVTIPLVESHFCCKDDVILF